MRTVLLLVCVGPGLVGCIHENPDYRIDENSGLDPKERSALLKLDCSQRREELLAARDDSQSDADRIANYKLALKAYDASASRLDAAFTKEPDLLYAAEGDALRLRQQRCQAQSRSLTDELRKFELSVKYKAQPTEPVVAAAPERAEPKVAAPAKKKSKRAKAAFAKKHSAHGVAVASAVP